MNGKKQWLKTDAMEFLYFGEIHNLEAGADPGFVGPLSHNFFLGGVFFKKKNAELRIQN